jgi:pimeloyl-ACP methyl ester carboxylesterase
MPRVRRPDGVEIHWEHRGQGPLVVVANQFFGHTSVFAGLIELLAEDHRVATYDGRGTGQSTRRGPYDLQTDAADLGGVIEAAGGPAVLLTMGDGSNRAVKLAAARPKLVRAVFCVAGNPIGRVAVGDTDALVASDSVLDALLSMMDTDYRGALRTMLGTANPDMDEDAVRARVNLVVEYCPQEAGAPRMRAWVADEALAASRQVGDRLWILQDKDNPWFLEIARRTAELLPDAHVHEVEYGPISRPQIAAWFVRKVTAAALETVRTGD